MIKVLIVEDDPMVAHLNKRYVETINEFEVVNMLTDGQEALKYIKSQYVDLIILDIYMPRLDGIKLLEQMRKNFIMTDVILVTAAKEVANIDEALKLGAVDYLIKPFEYERLKKSLQNYLVRYNLIHHKNIFVQEDIDKITNRYPINSNNTMQKGLHEGTLRRIREFMDKNNDRFVTAEEVSGKTGLSRVTVRRYLEFLVSIGYISTEVEYGSIGRPTHLYKTNKK